MSPTDLKSTLQNLAAGKSLGEDEMSAALETMTTGGATPVQMAAFLMALRVRGETLAELTGAARFMRAKMLPVDAPEDAVDIVGTGGDGHNTYNVSTCAAFVPPAPGCPSPSTATAPYPRSRALPTCSRHSASSSTCPPATISQAIREAGVGFLWAPSHHPAMKAWAPIRAELGVRTIFNLLGPISNPANVKRQVVGVFDRKWVEPIAGVLSNLGSRHAWVVHGHDGLDELSTTGPTTVAELNDGMITVFEVNPEDAGLNAHHARRPQEAATPKPTPRRSAPCSPASPAPIATSCYSTPPPPSSSPAKRPASPTASRAPRRPSAAAALAAPSTHSFASQIPGSRRSA